MAKGTCAVEDCETRATCREWCKKHYNRWVRTGDPLGLRSYVCVECGEPFTIAPRPGTRPNRCSRECLLAYEARRGKVKYAVGGGKERARANYLANRDRILAEYREMYRRDPARKKQRALEYRQRHPQRNRERARAWRRANRLRRREAENRRRARKASARVDVVLERDLRRMWHRYRNCCAYCSQPATTIDHVIPLAAGGRHSIGNLLPCCLSCNPSKGPRLLVVWRYRTYRV